MADIPAERRTAVVPAPQEMRIKSGWYETRRTDVEKAVGKWTADATLPKEGYAIAVTQEGIVVRFADEDGRFWAVETLKQLAEKTADGLRLPCVRIRDWPRYGWRGIHLDECRHFFGKDEVKKTLDLMAMHKLNVFHWHLTEDQAWRLEIPGYPDLVKYGTVEAFDATLADVGHLYPSAGEYRIRLSDDVSKLGIGAATSSSEYNTVYAPMVTGFFSNGSRLTSMGPYSLRGCVNLTAFDVEGAAVETISNFAFKGCAALSGELRFPRVTSILGGMAGLVFSGCTGIGVLRFGSANEAAVKSSPGWAASGGKFGAVNAEVFFDL